MQTILVKRGSRAQVDAACAAGMIQTGEPYLLLDEGVTAVGLSSCVVSATEPAFMLFDRFDVVLDGNGGPRLCGGSAGAAGTLRFDGGGVAGVRSVIDGGAP
jgi:hypothetical protein